MPPPGAPRRPRPPARRPVRAGSRAPTGLAGAPGRSAGPGAPDGESAAGARRCTRPRRSGAAPAAGRSGGGPASRLPPRASALLLSRQRVAVPWHQEQARGERVHHPRNVAHRLGEPAQIRIAPAQPGEPGVDAPPRLGPHGPHVVGQLDLHLLQRCVHLVQAGEAGAGGVRIRRRGFGHAAVLARKAPQEQIEPTVTVTTPAASSSGNCPRSTLAGACVTLPARSKADPWQGQYSVKVPGAPAGAGCTVHCWWVQTAERATGFPVPSGRVTRSGPAIPSGWPSTAPPLCCSAG